MRSGTSCFDFTLYRKTMARFWPLWALYGLIWLFSIPLRLLNSYMSYLRLDSQPNNGMYDWIVNNALELPELLTGGVIVAVVGGVLCAMAVFGYLYNNRSACMMHALPLRRQSLFTTQYLAGLSFLILPNVVVAALTAALEVCILPAGYWGQAMISLGIWLAVQSAACLFFFSFATFCAMFTGNILALPVFYGILNGLVIGLYSLVRALMSEFFYGFPSWTSDYPGLVEYCTPLVKMIDASHWNSGINSVAAGAYLAQPMVIVYYAIAGVVLAVLALLIYRTHHVETAGDVVAVAVVRPIFRCGVSFCVGLSMGMFTAAFFGFFQSSAVLTVCVLLWTVVGYFVAEMFLRKSFRVLSVWKGCLVMAGVVLLLCVSCFLDLLGIENRVPAVDRITSVEVGGSVLGYPSDGAQNSFTVTDPAQIEKIVNLHQAVLQQHKKQSNEENGNDYISMKLAYHLQGGGVIHREYGSVPIFEEDLNEEGSVTWAANQLAQDPVVVKNAYGFDQYDISGWIADTWENGEYHADRDHNVSAYLDGVLDQSGQTTSVSLDGAAGEDLSTLWQAVQADFREGTIGVRYLFDNDDRMNNTCRADLIFEFHVPGQRHGYTYRNVTITLTPNAKNTLACLRDVSGLDKTYTLTTYGSWANGEGENQTDSALSSSQRMTP